MYTQSFPRNRFQRNRFGSGQRNNRRQNAVRGESIRASRYVQKAEIVSGTPPVIQHHSFRDFLLDNRIKENIKARGYTEPTPIQDQAIPHILAGRDVVGIANTGTGKTAAFLLPLIHKIILNRSEKALVIVPTRELAMQVEEELVAFSRNLHIPSLLCIGGSSMNLQIAHLRRSPNMLIGTPGRLKDLIQRRVLNLSQFHSIVLDEVDRMVDIGFLHDITHIISLLPSERQSLFFSATVSSDVTPIIASFLKNPVTVSVKVEETVRSIDQDVIRVMDKNEKIDKLSELLKQEEFTKVLIFGRTKWGVEKLSKRLRQDGFLADSIHGNKSQNERFRALARFKQNQLKVLVATDIAARGLDIDDVSHVINFDEPATYTDYVHRIGRTGRANKSGKALTFVM